jgi:hypothetical protein
MSGVTLIKIKVAEASRRFWRELLWLMLFIGGLLLFVAAIGALKAVLCYFDPATVNGAQCFELRQIAPGAFK